MWIQLNRRATNVAAPFGGSDSTELEKGFSLIEVVIALLIIMIAVLGVFHAVTYAIVYNYGNKTRGQALSVMQQEVEVLRSKKFTLAVTDPDLAGGTHTKTVTTSTGMPFEVEYVVDNEPMVDGIQDDTYQCLTPQAVVIPCSFKEITVLVKMIEPAPDWRSAVPPRTILRRTRGN
jgi:type II secretory pathway pseudopilin PulG